MKKILFTTIGVATVLTIAVASQWQNLSLELTGDQNQDAVEMAKDYDAEVRSGEKFQPTPDGKQLPTGSSEDKGTDDPVTDPKYGLGKTLVATDNPEQVVKYAKDHDLTVEKVRKFKGREALVTLKESPDDPKVDTLATDTSAKTSANYRYHILGHSTTPNDTHFDDQWNMQTIGAPKGWHVTAGASSTTIAVIDSGVLFEQTVGDPAQTFTQPDFPAERRWTNPGETGMTTSSDTCWTGTEEDKSTNNCDDDSNGYKDDWQGWDFMGGWNGDQSCPNYDSGQSFDTYYQSDNNPQPYSCDSPDHPRELNKTHFDGTCTAFESACYVGHGTLVGSVATAATNNSAIIAGIDRRAAVMNLRVVDGYGYTTTDRITEAVRYATDHGADVINLSLGVGCGQDFTDPTLEAALKDAKAADIVVAAASGNNGNDNYICYPASSSATIAVGATDRNDKRASFSDGSKKLDVVAPGKDIPAANAPSDAYPDQYYSGANGTSLSSPHVAGQAALLRAIAPNATSDTIREYIVKNVDKISGMNGKNFTKGYGYGRINVRKSLKFVTEQHPDGTLVRNDKTGAVFLLENGMKRHITSPTVFANHGFKWKYVLPASPADIKLPDGDTVTFREGTLLKGDGSKIYIADYENGNVQKRHITSPSVFNKLGFEFDEVITVSNNSLPSQTGPNVNSAARHPDGVIVHNKENGAVYLIEGGQKRHIVSPLAFRTQGFSWGQVKDATNGDLELANGNKVKFHEGTLLKSGPPIYVVGYQSGVIKKRHVKNLFIFRLLDLTDLKLHKVKTGQLPEQNGDPIQ